MEGAAVTRKEGGVAGVKSRRAPWRPASRVQSLPTLAIQARMVCGKQSVDEIHEEGATGVREGAVRQRRGSGWLCRTVSAPTVASPPIESRAVEPPTPAAVSSWAKVDTVPTATIAELPDPAALSDESSGACHIRLLY